LNAIGQRTADNKGTFEGVFTIDGVPPYTCGKIPTGTAQPVTTASSTSATVETGDLGCLVPTYMAQLPSDPEPSTAPDTGYTVLKDAAGRITVCAPKAAHETAIPDPAPICVTR
jgi:hypothetical protein